MLGSGELCMITLTVYTLCINLQLHSSVCMEMAIV